MPSLSAPPPRPEPPATADGTAFTRREALRLLVAQMALAVSACSKPDEEILPYVRMPERVTPGVPLRFATTLPLGGYGRGVVGVSVDGRPIKIEGNPLHLASQGSTDVFAEAAVLSLYDPDRSRTVLQGNAIASWDMFSRALLPVLERLQARQGEGLRLLTGRVTSPTLARQIDGLLRAFPQAAWHVHEPADDAARAGAALAYGRPLDALPRFETADVVLALDADPLGPGPDQIRNARGWAARRDPQGPNPVSRLYALEAAPTLTGAKADNRLALHPRDI